MQHTIFAILDKATEAYGRPFVARTENDAIRTIQMEVNRHDTQNGNMLASHPEDYALYRVGHWDDETGEIKGLQSPPFRVIECSSLVKNQ